MENKRKYRHEYKFLIDERQKAQIFYRLKGLLPIDSHVSEKGSYRISSMYFDDYRDSCYQQNESGINERSKYRIRIYDISSIIRLERKSKKNGLTSKDMVILSREQADALLAGKTLPMDAENQPLMLQQFQALMLSKGFRPKTIVEYERIPFIYDQGNVRITLDMNLTSSMELDRFFEKDRLRYPVLPKGQQLLEVKYDEYLPTFIKEQLELGTLSQTSFSKYYLCRKYSLPCKGGRLR